jgi:hypothetical protein
MVIGARGNVEALRVRLSAEARGKRGEGLVE